MRFPSIQNVASDLRGYNQEADSHPEGHDVRLQVYKTGDWAVRFGDSSFDQDHRGYWGSSSIPGGNRRFHSENVARDLISQAKDQYYSEKTYGG